MSDYGDFNPSQVVRMKFNTTAFSTGAPATLSGTPAVKVYKDNSTTESSAGVTLSVDFDGLTGLTHIDIDTSADAVFYAKGHDYQAVISAGTSGGTSVVGAVVGSFSIQNRAALRPATAGRDLLLDSNNRVDLGAVNGDAGSASNLRSMLDGTGGGVFSLKQLRLSATDRPAFYCVSTSASDNAFYVQGADVGATGMHVEGGLVGMTVTGGAGKGLSVQGATDGFWISGTNADLRLANSTYYWNTTQQVAVSTRSTLTATQVWQDATAGDFTAAGSIGKSLFTGVAPGASGGFFLTTSSLATPQVFNLIGSVSSVSGAVNSVTNSVGSVAGNLNGSVNTIGSTGLAAIENRLLDALVANHTVIGSITALLSLIKTDTGNPVNLASTGLDNIAITGPASGPATNFRQMVVQTWRRFFKGASLTATQQKTFADDGTTVVTTQAVANDGTTQTQGPAS